MKFVWKKFTSHNVQPKNAILNCSFEKKKIVLQIITRLLPSKYLFGCKIVWNISYDKDKSAEDFSNLQASMSRIIQMKFYHKEPTHLQCVLIGVPSFEIVLLMQITDSSKNSFLK